MAPVFRGLEELKASGKDLAAIAGVSPSTYCKWRTGHSKIPASKLVLLTMVFADLVGEHERRVMGKSGYETSDPRQIFHLKALRRFLRHQESINIALPPLEVRDGARQYREWALCGVIGSHHADDSNPLSRRSSVSA